MTTEEINFWNERFGGEEYIYGDEPNVYLKEKLAGLPIGKILFPAEGEGRNSVFSAILGWDVYAFDQSESGKRKALQLAKKKGVEIVYKISTLKDYQPEENQYDAMALIYAHLPSSVRRKFHQKLSKSLKPGGYLILEGFSKKHGKFQKLNPTAGGPKDMDMLYDLDEIKLDFPDFDFLEANEVQTQLEEGNYHLGDAMVVRIFGRKK